MFICPFEYTDIFYKKAFGGIKKPPLLFKGGFLNIIITG